MAWRGWKDVHSGTLCEDQTRSDGGRAEPPGCGEAVWRSPEHDHEDASVFGSAGLPDERGFSGGYTIVREYVAQATLRAREMFVPLSHRPGHAQADFGEADGYIAGSARLPAGGVAQSILQSALTCGYRPPKMPGRAGHMGNVG